MLGRWTVAAVGVLGVILAMTEVRLVFWFVLFAWSGLGASFGTSWTDDPGSVTRYAVRLSQPAIVPADGGADIEYSGRIKSLDPETRSGVVIVGAKSQGRKIFGLATLTVRFS